MPTWHRAAAVDELSPGTGRELTIGDRIVALFRVGDEFFAIDGICAHAGGPVGKGALQGTIVTCPWHGWQYDVTTGQHCLNHYIRQQSFATKVASGEVFVELP